MGIKIIGNKIKCEKCGHVNEWSYNQNKQKHEGEVCEKCGKQLIKFIVMDMED